MEPIGFVCSTKTEVSNFYPEKVFRCPCLLGTVTECWQKGLIKYHQFYDKINESNLFNGPSSVIGCGVDRKKCCLFYVISI